MAKPIPCVTCKKIVAPTEHDFPFCSERCKLIDLGKWCSGEYTISTPIYDPEVLDEVARAREHAGLLMQEDELHQSRWKN
ncbi:hypothetical protein SAMN05421819_1857 [Bryocella elongata]|uniref:DNA gyrase inhibitor YacG n=1 Tax=Bryocella elongata TaxID=863522 RepID=A0A1H5X4D6_9BACT|nr:DNA gyrase inhibitor YacG [Bryocella elongata]SEG06250.1 hypothetical protein SAMN05421819_1857 [Bryocella elongata]